MSMKLGYRKGLGPEWTTLTFGADPNRNPDLLDLSVFCFMVD